MSYHWCNHRQKQWKFIHQKGNKTCLGLQVHLTNPIATNWSNWTLRFKTRIISLSSNDSNWPWILCPVTIILNATTFPWCAMHFLVFFFPLLSVSLIFPMIYLCLSIYPPLLFFLFFFPTFLVLLFPRFHQLCMSIFTFLQLLSNFSINFLAPFLTSKTSLRN